MAGGSQLKCSEAGAADKPRPQPIDEMPGIYASDAIPMPPYRPLNAFAFDPAAGMIVGNSMTVQVRYEELKPGPIGDRFAVIDYDGNCDVFYKPVDYADDSLLINGGMRLSQADPRFHQQMVYAVASETLQRFEAALGRQIHWKLPEKNRPGLSPREAARRLNLFPHAMRQENAFYCREAHGILFGYFKAKQKDQGRNLPGQTVFTCLSHDIIAHETTHAIVDGIRSHFIEATSYDTPAFHEAFSDIAALFSHFSHKDVLLDTLKKTGGKLYQLQLTPDASDKMAGGKGLIQAQTAENNPLIGLATQFSQARGMGASLRSALGSIPDPNDLKTRLEPHERGSILVAAVFDAYFTVYQRRTADLFAIWRSRGAASDSGLPAELAERLAAEASLTADQFFVICARALDYCPPVDMTFGDFLRAILTADLDLRPDDPEGVREAIMEAFRARGLLPEEAQAYSQECLFWPRVDMATGSTRKLPAVKGLVFGDPNGLTRDEKEENGKILRAYAKDNGALLGLLDPEIHPIAVPSFHPIFHIAQDGSLFINMVVELVQTLELPFDDGESGTFLFRNGVTLLIAQNRVMFDGARPPPSVLFAIPKLHTREREKRVRDYLRWKGQGRDKSTFKIDFSMVHIGE
jgi:hypothetical protein